MRAHVCVRVCACVCWRPQGLNPGVLARMHEWTFGEHRLELVPNHAPPLSAQPTALRLALTQLNTHLNEPTPIILLRAWQLTPELIQAVSTALPADFTLRLGVDVGRVCTEAVLSQVQSMGPRVCCVAADGTADSLTPRPVFRPWPWPVTVAETLNTAQLAQILSSPLRNGHTTREIHYTCIHYTRVYTIVYCSVYYTL